MIRRCEMAQPACVSLCERTLNDPSCGGAAWAASTLNTLNILLARRPCDGRGTNMGPAR